MHILNLARVDSNIFRTLACLGTLFRHHSEPLTYLDSFRHSQEQFMHILNLAWVDSDIFRTLACLGTLFRHIHKVTDIEAYLPHWDSGMFRILALQACNASYVKQHLLFKSGYSFKSFVTFFFYFCFKSKHSIFFQDSISIITIKVIMACHPDHATYASTPPTLALHSRKHATHATHARKSPTQAHHPHHPR